MWYFYLMQASVQLIQHSEGYGLKPVSVKLLCRQSHLVCSYIPIRFGLIVILSKDIAYIFCVSARRCIGNLISTFTSASVRICNTVVIWVKRHRSAPGLGVCTLRNITMSSPTKKRSASNISSEGSSDSSNHEFSDYSSAAAVTLPSAWEGKVAAATA